MKTVKANMREMKAMLAPNNHSIRYLDAHGERWISRMDLATTIGFSRSGLSTVIRIENLLAADVGKMHSFIFLNMAGVHDVLLNIRKKREDTVAICTWALNNIFGEQLAAASKPEESEEPRQINLFEEKPRRHFVRLPSGDCVKLSAIERISREGLMVYVDTASTRTKETFTTDLRRWRDCRVNRRTRF